jgi:GT2 family glycosyltransferase
LRKEVTVSVVSHNHGVEVERVIAQLLKFPEINIIILIMNAGPERCRYADDARVLIIQNNHPIGFGSNHNKAFLSCETDFYCVLNPDVEFVGNPFPKLLQAFDMENVGLVAPRVKSSGGKIQDSARKFPNIFSLIGKLLGFDRSNIYVDCVYPTKQVEWCAGMFMLFRLETYQSISGFDEKFFLYYEDTDICARIRLTGAKIWLVADEWIIHNGKRGSRKSIKLFIHHASSMIRYFIKYKFGFGCPNLLK